MGKNNEKISIIVPVYKVEQYLDRCVKSVRKQTYTNLEIILVDDGSPDHCPQMCDEYAKDDERIVVIHKENGGLSSARNAALDVATGSYILCVDSDDYVHVTAVEKLYKACIDNDADISMGLHYVEKGEKLLIEDPIVDETEVYGSFEALQVLLKDKNMRSYAWNKLYKADLFENVRYPEGRNYEDIATTYLLFDKAKRICRIPQYLYYYQMRDDSISSNIGDEKWYKNCKALVSGFKEQFAYFEEKGQVQLAKISMYHLAHYIFTLVDTGYRLRKDFEEKEDMEFLFQNKQFIYANELIENNVKSRLKLYEKTTNITKVYNKSKKVMKKIISIKARGTNLLKSYGICLANRYDFTLKEGKDTRLVIFELPCFDNLGDHAIAYAQHDAVKKYADKHQNCQVYVVKGWDTIDGIAELKKCIGANDVIFCQGGGNFGNLYPFSDAFRNKLFEAFFGQRIVVFPQTILFSKDEAGEKAFEESKAVINKCNKMTLCARDHVSYELMKDAYSVNVVEMCDIVSYLDKKGFAERVEDRHGVLLCLRSDIESALNSTDKMKLRSVCERLTADLLISDTVIGYDVPEEQREEILHKKWSTFGKAKMVVTDRLHGMIFALITETPCVILGNNHHKVKETFKTLEDCGYLYYAESVDEADAIIENVYAMVSVNNRRVVGDIVEKLEQLIL